METAGPDSTDLYWYT